MKIVLASASLRRQELLQQIGCAFEVFPSAVQEDNTLNLSPDELVVAHAKAKAMDVAARSLDGTLVIGADTLVVLNGQVFGKPRSQTEAKSMLNALSGQEHKVITGLAVIQCNAGHIWTDFSVTQVKFGHLSQEEIDRYVASGEPMDKAGAYGIQEKGALFVESIHGCYFNVVGLPIYKLAKILKKAGVFLP